MRSLFFVVLLLAAPGVLAEEGTESLTIEVGKTVSLKLLVAPVVCDDTTLVKVEDGIDKLMLRGLRPGKTQCGCWTIPGFHVLVDVLVVPARKEK